MRAHGVTNFPDPRPGSGGIQIPDNLNPRSPSFRSAQQACKQLRQGRLIFDSQNA